MKSSNTLLSEVHLVRSFNRSARLFLLATLINGIVYSIWWLFFNFYILELGYNREFLGLVNSASPAATLILGIPLGLLSDRIGRKRAMIIGVAFYVLAAGLQVIVLNPVLIILMAFISGGGHTLYFISQPPFLMRVSNAENRTLLFSLNFGLITLSGAFGSLLAGYLPAFFGEVLGIPVGSAIAYRAVLLLAVCLGFLSLIPLALLREREGISYDQENNSLHGTGATHPAIRSLKTTLTRPFTRRVALPNLFMGLGAAILIPYMNIYFNERYSISDQNLGLLFSLSSIMMGIGSFIGPRLALELGGKIRAVVLTQGLSLFFLLVLGFSPYIGLASIAFLMRSALMNMSVPLFDTFTMENVIEREQATVVSIRELVWQIGWTFGPYISGIVQESYGFTPLFIATAILYCVSIIMTWFFFHNSENVQPAIDNIAIS